jgi:hypothetical protein
MAAFPLPFSETRQSAFGHGWTTSIVDTNAEAYEFSTALGTAWALPE